MKKSVVTRRRRTTPRGMALISVMSIGLASMLSLLSFAYLTIILSRAEGFQKQRELLFAAAETGLEYSLSEINLATASGEYATIEPGITGTEKVTEMLSKYVDPINGSAQTRVFIRVKNILNSDIDRMSTLSNVYDPTFDPSRGPKGSHTFQKPQRSEFSNSYWKVVEVTAIRGNAFSSLRAILKPSVGSQSQSSTPFQENAILARNVNLDATYIGSDLPVPKIFKKDGIEYPYQQFDSTIVSNGFTNIAKNTTVQANLQVAFSNTGAPSTAVSMGENSSIQGQLFTNDSNLDRLGGLNSSTGKQPSPGDNVKAIADIQSSGSRQGANEFMPTDTTAASNSTVPAAAPNTPSDAVSLPPFSSESATSLSGKYVSPALIATDSILPVNVSGPTEIYLEGSSGAKSAIDINAQFFQNSGVPANLKIWYNGSKPVTLTIPSGKTLNGIVYAPNASVSITGDGIFKGSVTADSLTTNISKFEMMSTTDLKNALGTRPKTASGEPPLGAYKIASWQQVNDKLVSPN